MKTATVVLLAILLLFSQNSPLFAQEQKGKYFDPTRLPGFEAIQEQAGPFEQLEVEAYVLVKAHKYDEAAGIYSRLVDIRPYASSLWIMLAHCYNGMNRWEDAYNAADIAVKLDPACNYYRIERGIAAFRMEKNDQALEDLAAYVGEITQSAQGHFYLGLARIVDRDYERAESSLRTAASLDPEMELIAGPFIAQLALRKGGRQEALSRLAELSLVFEGMPLEKAIQDRMEEIKSGRQAEAGKDWSVYLSVKGFYDSNVISANDDAALPAEISSRRDEGIAYDMGGRYRFFHKGDTSLTAVLDVDGQAYFSLDDYDTLSIRPALRLDHRFNNQWTGRFLARYAYTWLDSRSYNSTFGLAPSLTHQWGRTNHYTTFGSELKVTDYSQGTAPAVDRDGTDWSFFLKHHLLFLNNTAQAGAGFTIGRNRTDGTEYDADYFRFTVYMALPIGWEIVFAPSLSYTRYDYENISIFAATPTRRDNDILEARFSLSRPITKRLSAFIDMSYTDNSSNIQAFEYDRTMVFAGITLQF